MEGVKEIWQDNDLVFPSTIGTTIDPSNLLKKFRQLLKKTELPKINQKNRKDDSIHAN